ncbi:putative NIPSNAP family containing protein [Vibrio nigripulchritudo MADA3029]|uniref:NIPSNAP family protein n=1 Tax=Vibrio nigripulchritudo TaxID=28173 RepID=UPI00021C22D5|nr:NIPSNAP family protein [Vibrio nigripulchritudo]EGU58983.1 NIPSNAP family protein [Vibrio nigripulchritudo ATCC 27043]KJY73792.1 NIPSNAP domain-containing protein [Vibrio nigripulchritudo]CCN46663.1 putative NIPSNAP family containing protein [Vibrio nigripulchritudo MADA3020]CCN54560.1 putative NIPSNAP family containing protein [Vibrio nigripulchritudo MADA3021]CCN59522.1 putative NIPSNAP family containing protein [Vibrio nigripulchritudo MADA3029]
MTITCFIEYRIDPFKVSLFEQYAENWSKIIPECGGDLLGYFVPHEGTNYCAYGLISFPSLSEYEAYRKRLKESELGKSNFNFAKDQQFIIEEKRTFLKVVSSTYKQAPNSLGGAA